MSAFRPHCGWLAAVLVALILAGGGNPLLCHFRRSFDRRFEQLDAKRQQLTHSLRQLHDDAALAESLSRSIDVDDVVLYLTPVDRLDITLRLESLASSSRLDRFTYTLSPEQPFKPHPADADSEGLVQSVLSLEAQAPLDTDVFKFIRQALQLLPGHADLGYLSIARITSGGPGQFGPVNVRFNATINWLSNESKKAAQP